MLQRALSILRVRGNFIKRGDKVVIGMSSANRDEEVIDNPTPCLIDRPKARQHLSFGSAFHRCMGNRLAEMQLRVLWEKSGSASHTWKWLESRCGSYRSFVQWFLPSRYVRSPW